MQKHIGIESSINSLRASLNNKKGFEIEEANVSYSRQMMKTLEKYK